MSSVKGKMVRFLGSLLLKRGRIVGVEELSESFRRIRLTSDAPASKAGDKWQILLESDDVRTYTPIPAESGATWLLGWKHAGGPGARWIADVQVGADVLFAGPDRSLTLPWGPIMLVGDETSVATAASFEMERPGQVRAIFQAGAPEEVRQVSSAVGLSSVHVSARGELEELIAAVVAAKSASPEATIALTGGSEFVIAARSALRAHGISGSKTKTYWIPGKTGLD